MRAGIPAACRNGNAYPFPRLVGEELGTLAVVGPGAVVARDQLPAPVQVTPAISVACGETRDTESAGKREKIHPRVEPILLGSSAARKQLLSPRQFISFINLLAEKCHGAFNKLRFRCWVCKSRREALENPKAQNYPRNSLHLSLWKKK